MVERFYLKYQAPCLEGAEHHHLARVLRVTEGQKIELVDGKGNLTLALVQKIEKEKTILTSLETKHFDPPSPQVFLGIPFMRPSKLEWVLEKATEIGVSGFFLYPAKKSTQKAFSKNHLQRFESIRISALKQSKRLYLPHFEILSSLEEVLAKDAVCYFGDIREDAPTLKCISIKEDVLFVSGPEGGFVNEELNLLGEKATGVRISPNILRAETAPLVASSLFKFLSDSF